MDVYKTDDVCRLTGVGCRSRMYGCLAVVGYISLQVYGQVDAQSVNHGSSTCSQLLNCRNSPFLSLLSLFAFFRHDEGLLII